MARSPTHPSGEAHDGPFISAIRARHLRAPLTRPTEFSFATMSFRQIVLIEIETADGTTGYGESWINHPPWAAHERLATIREGIVPLLLGRDPRNITAILQELKTQLTPLARQWGAYGPIMQAISGVSIALWDLLGKLRGVPIADMLGGRARSSILAYASSLGQTGIERVAQDCVDRGFHMVKLKLGFNHDQDMHNLVLASSVLDSRSKLCADANQKWSLEDALGIADQLKASRVAWIEEPISCNSLPAIAEFHERTGLRVATGENLYGLEGFLPYIHSEHIAVLQPDVTKTGGISDFVAICNVAATHNKTVIPHCYGGAIALAATLQLAAACPEVQFVEFDISENPLLHEIVSNAIIPVGGSLRIPGGPGLGIDLDFDAVERYEVGGFHQSTVNR